MTHQKYWENFYKKFDIKEASSFATFAYDYIQKNNIYISNFIELGCGNGRDSSFFLNKGYNVTGVDFASNLESDERFTFISSDINKLVKKYECENDIVYSRFFLHSINNASILKILKWTKKYFMAEFRAKEDKPVLYKNHYRNLISSQWILQQMLKHNFDILYFQKANNLAIYKNENPILIRVIGMKNAKNS
jgi:hypothetical protein